MAHECAMGDHQNNPNYYYYYYLITANNLSLFISLCNSDRKSSVEWLSPHWPQLLRVNPHFPPAGQGVFCDGWICHRPHRNPAGPQRSLQVSGLLWRGSGATLQDAQTENWHAGANLHWCVIIWDYSGDLKITTRWRWHKNLAWVVHVSLQTWTPSSTWWSADSWCLSWQRATVKWWT